MSHQYPGVRSSRHGCGVEPIHVAVYVALSVLPSTRQAPNFELQY